MAVNPRRMGIRSARGCRAHPSTFPLVRYCKRPLPEARIRPRTLLAVAVDTRFLRGVDCLGPRLTARHRPQHHSLKKLSMMGGLLGNRTRIRFGSRRIRTKSTNPDVLMGLIRSLAPVIPPQGLIRLGPASDGGYLVPDDLAGIRACFSPGVSKVSDFEFDCANRGMQVFLADR